MQSGAHLNITEDRAVMHTALRAPRDATVTVDGENVVPAVHGVLDRIDAFAESVRTGLWRVRRRVRVRSQSCCASLSPRP